MESGNLITYALQSLSEPEGSVRLTDLPCSQVLRVEENEESVTKYADLCFQFLRLDEEEDLSIGARSVDHATMCAKDRPSGVDLPRQSLEYACEDASCSSCEADEDGPYQSGSNGIAAWGNETSEAVQLDGGEVDKAGCVDVFELCGADVFEFDAFDEVPLSDADTEEFRDVPPPPDLSEGNVDEIGRYFAMSNSKRKEGTDGADSMSADGGGLRFTNSRGERKEEMDVEDTPSEDDEPPEEPIERPIAEVVFFQTRHIFSDWRYE